LHLAEYINENSKIWVNKNKIYAGLKRD